ncbi:MAG: hypothetical protein AB1349_03305 [Elusimicrobiota bacterium]
MVILKAIKNYKLKIKNCGLFLTFIFHFSFFIFHCLYGYTYRGAVLGLGDSVGGFTARNAAVGEVSVLSGGEPTSIFANPSELSVDSRVSISQTNELINGYERRLHNDAEQTTISNSNLYLLPTSGAVSVCPIKQKLAVAIGAIKILDSNYHYTENVYGEIRVVEKNSISADGEIYIYGGGASYIPVEWLKLGVAGFLITGKPDRKITEILFSPQTGSETSRTTSIVNNSFSGSGFRIGTVLQSEELKLGIALNNLLSVKNDYSINGQMSRYEYRFPATLSAGFAFKFRGITRPTFLIQLDYTWWGSAEQKVANSKWTDIGYCNTLSWHFGAEHWLKHDIPFRYGLAVVQDQTRKGVQTSVVSIGSGLKLWIIQWDIALQYFMRRITSETRLFPVEENAAYPLINLETVDDYTKRLTLTGTVKW